MDLVMQFLNTVVPPITFIISIILLPPFLVFKLLSSIKRSLCAEDVAGKAVLITGASSGIGEHLAFEYARRGAKLALVARREDQLQGVAAKARQFGSPKVVAIPADVSKVGDCKRMVEEAVEHFGRLDCLVNNAGISRRSTFEDIANLSDFAPVMDTNFWGSVYATHFAVPQLRKSKGRIIVVSSSAAWLPLPRSSFYTASKAALTSFYDALRMEFGSDIGITIVTPGWVDTAMIPGNIRPQQGTLKFSPVESAERCAKAIVESACRGDKCLIEPSWIRAVILLKWFYPDILEHCTSFLIKRPTKVT